MLKPKFLPLLWIGILALLVYFAYSGKLSVQSKDGTGSVPAQSVAAEPCSAPARFVAAEQSSAPARFVAAEQSSASSRNVATGFSLRDTVRSSGFGAKSKDEILTKAAKLQIPFVENQGQVKDKNVRFYANTFAGNIFVTEKGEIVYSLQKAVGSRKKTEGKVRRLEFGVRRQDSVDIME